jgi:ribosomal protein L11 methylase PrmA
MKVKVKKVFQDKYTKALYQVGRELDFEDESRIKDLVKRSLVEVMETKKEEKKDSKGIILFDKEFDKKTLVDALKTIGAKVSGNMGESTLLGLVSELDEEKVAQLKEELGK